MKGSNANIADLLRSVATAITLSKGNFFEIRAYNNAADAIEHSTAEVRDLWQEAKLDEIPGLGKSIQAHLDEYFKTGKVKHFESLLKKHPEVIYELIKVPGIGPKTAQELAHLGVKSFDDLGKKLENNELVNKGFSEKIAQNLKSGFLEHSNRDNRMLLPYAQVQADKILEYLKKGPGVKQADPLGSLRRQVATIGDLDFAASADDPEKVYEYFHKLPGVAAVKDKQTVVLASGVHVDLLVGKPESYGALLQHFTGGKSHNIKLRTYALKKGLSLNEEGITRIKNHESRIKGNLVATRTEKEFYDLLGMDVPAPEIREDSGEIEAAIKHSLPKLVEFSEIKGDFHLHSNFPIDSSHDYGTGSLEEIVKKGLELGYKYIGLSDHAPALGTHTKEQIIALVEKRTKVIHNLQSSYKSIRVLNGLEIDIASDGSLTLPEEALKLLDFTVVGIHTGHRGSKEALTKRIIAALNNPYSTILAHPTGRLINERDSYEADWEEIFKLANKNKKLLEINAYPNRLDLRDDLVRMALKFGVKFIINTDSHTVEQMNNMRFGVSVARRGWATKEDIANTWDWKKLAQWFNI